jgi:sugar fermentation stimulation protein A
MRFTPALVPGILLRRYKRFLADVRLENGSVVVAHCTNTGRMTGCSDPGSACLLAPAPESSTRKLRWTLTLVKAGRTWVSVDTQLPNRIVADAARRRRLETLTDYDTVATEVPYGEGRRSRIDVLLTDSTGRLPPCYVEIKNTTLAAGRTALFPDAVSTRALKHLHELGAEVAAGHRAVILPFIARGDCHAFDAADEIDPDWSRELDVALAAGVELLPLRARIDRHGIRIGPRLPHRRRTPAAGA